MQQTLPQDVFTRASRVLVSGIGAGSEMIIARRLFAGEVYGTEVEAALLPIAELRFAGLRDLFAVHYDGQNLPWPDEHFDVVISGHIIEHTFSPAAYLAEHMRVLRPGGYLYIEFPNRYHRRELHTGLPSLEWLPHAIRNASLRVLSSRFSPISTESRRRYESILGTGLHQVSLGSIRRWLRRTGRKTELLHHYQPVPGIVRAIFFVGP